MCLLLESIRIFQNKPQHLEWHEQRLNKSRKALFGSNLMELKLSDIVDPSALNPNIVYKARILAGREVETIEFIPYEKKAIKSLKLIEAPSLGYEHKFADREALEILFAKRDSADDILLTKNGGITDASYANACFWDGSSWVTSSTPLLKGTKRALLLERKVIKEQPITVADLPSFEKISLINSMLDLEEVQLPVSQIIY